VQHPDVYSSLEMGCGSSVSILVVVGGVRNAVRTLCRLSRWRRVLKNLWNRSSETLPITGSLHLGVPGLHLDWNADYPWNITAGFVVRRLELAHRRVDVPALTRKKTKSLYR
jgi:hypothetical protein